MVIWFLSQCTFQTRLRAHMYMKPNVSQTVKLISFGQGKSNHRKCALSECLRLNQIQMDISSLNPLMLVVVFWQNHQNRSNPMLHQNSAFYYISGIYNKFRSQLQFNFSCWRVTLVHQVLCHHCFPPVSSS